MHPEAPGDSRTQGRVWPRLVLVWRAVAACHRPPSASTPVPRGAGSARVPGRPQQHMMHGYSSTMTTCHELDTAHRPESTGRSTATLSALSRRGRPASGMGLSFGNVETADFATSRPVPFVSGGAPTGEYRWSRHHHPVVQAAPGGGLSVRPPVAPPIAG